MDPMGPIRPTGEPSESSAEKTQVDGGFPSITRAEQAQQTQGVIREIARDTGWQSPQKRDLPKADGTGGLEEGTPLATRETLTPGQLDRVQRLPRPGTGISVRELHNIISRENGDETRLASHAAQAARHEFSSEYSEHEEPQSSILRTYDAGLGTDRVTTPVLNELLNVPIERATPNMKMRVGEALRRANTEEGNYKEKLAERIEEHRYAARRLYERDPERYPAMNADEFVGVLADYMRDEDELSLIEEVSVDDESAQVAQIERILGELGPDVGVKEVLDQLAMQADIPDMPQHQTFENFITKLLENKKQAIELAKAKAHQLKVEMARKYGGEVPSKTVEPTDNLSEDLDPHYDGRGYN